MKFLQYLIEMRKLSNTMIGFAVSGFNVQKVSDNMKQWMDNHKIQYDEVKEKHISIAQIIGTYPKDELVRKLHQIEHEVVFYPKNLKLFSGLESDWIVIEYKKNIDFLDAFNKIFKDFKIKQFDSGIKPHVSLFKVKKGSMKYEDLNLMFLNSLNLPIVKSNKVQLWNDKFKVEYEE